MSGLASPLRSRAPLPLFSPPAPAHTHTTHSHQTLCSQVQVQAWLVWSLWSLPSACAITQPDPAHSKKGCLPLSPHTKSPFFSHPFPHTKSPTQNRVFTYNRLPTHSRRAYHPVSTSPSMALASQPQVTLAHPPYSQVIHSQIPSAFVTIAIGRVFFSTFGRCASVTKRAIELVSLEPSKLCHHFGTTGWPLPLEPTTTHRITSCLGAINSLTAISHHSFNNHNTHICRLAQRLQGMQNTLCDPIPSFNSQLPRVGMCNCTCDPSAQHICTCAHATRYRPICPATRPTAPSLVDSPVPMHTTRIPSAKHPERIGHTFEETGLTLQRCLRKLLPSAVRPARSRRERARRVSLIVPHIAHSLDGLKGVHDSPRSLILSVLASLSRRHPTNRSHSSPASLKAPC